MLKALVADVKWSAINSWYSQMQLLWKAPVFRISGYLFASFSFERSWCFKDLMSTWSRRNPSVIIPWYASLLELLFVCTITQWTTFWSLPSIFQVLPQLLYFFGVKNDVDSLDWATIAVYSCEESCDGAASYKEEFAWVQVSSPSQVVPWKFLFFIQLLWLRGFYNSPRPPASFWWSYPVELCCNFLKLLKILGS